jgi:hypothetical protein
LGTALWQSDVRLAVDTNVGISTQLAFSISTSEGANISGGPVTMRCLWVLIKRTFIFACSHRFLGLEQEVHSAVLSQLTPENALYLRVGGV